MSTTAPPIPEILLRARDAGFVVFTKGIFNLNLIGVRHSPGTPNTFDDTLHVVYRDDTGEWVDRTYAMTTDPGTYWLQHPMNVDGTATLAPGQYRNCWAVGRHHGAYPCLIQVGQMTVWRSKPGAVGHTTDTGLFGIELHHAGTASTQVDKWSAGCQVLQRIPDLERVMELVSHATQIWGPRFSYTLMEGLD